MKKLDKTAIENRNKVQAALSEGFSELGEAVEAFNTAMHDAWAAVDIALTKYNKAVEDANAWQSEAATSIGDYIDARSEQWQQSEKGTAYEEWKGEYEEEIEQINLTEPDELDISDVEDGSETLGNRNEEIAA